MQVLSNFPGSAFGFSLILSADAAAAKTILGITGGLNYKGTWDASTNTPTLASGVGTGGDFYKVSVAGTTSIDGIANWDAGDTILFEGTTWQKLDGGSVETATSLALGGATIGANSLAVTGTALFNGAITLGAASNLGTPSALVLTNATGLPVGSITGLGTGIATFLATPTSANLIAAVTNETGTGSLVFATSPTLVTPILGVATATSIELGTQQTTQGSLILDNTAVGAFATTIKSSNSASAAWTLTLPTTAGTNLYVLQTNGSGVTSWVAQSSGGTPGGSNTQVQYNNSSAFGGISGATTDGTTLTLVAPVLGTPASGTLTNCTIPIGGVTGLAANVATFLATPTSANLIAAVTNETGTGSLVFATTPTLVTPVLGVATATSIAIGGATIGTDALGITGTVTISSTLAAAATTITSASATAFTVGRLGATTPAFSVDASTATSITGIKIKSAGTGGGVAVSASGETNVALTIDANGSGTITIGGTSTGAITLTRATTMSNALTYGGVTLSNAVTGTGNMVLATSPTLTTPLLGTPTSGVLSNCTAATQTAGDNSTKLATTAYVNSVLVRTRQVLTSGTTYTTPAGCRQLIARFVGGGGGSGGTSDVTRDAGAGGTGGTTSFNSINAIGGSGGAKGDGASNAGNGGIGGTGGTGGTSPTTWRTPGNTGGVANPTLGLQGGTGGNGPFGGGVARYVGEAPAANTGSGASGKLPPSGAYFGSGGGGSGEYVEYILNSPTGTYTYAIGAGGAAGAAGTGGAVGYAGGSGIIIVDEFY